MVYILLPFISLNKIAMTAMTNNM